jgi:hypothetical protein
MLILLHGILLPRISCGSRGPELEWRRGTWRFASVRSVALGAYRQCQIPSLTG